MIYLWQFQAIELNNKILLKGTILKGSGKGYRIPKTIIANLFGLIGTYRKKSLKKKIITIKCGDFETKSKTNKHGFFNQIIPACDKKDIQIYYKGEKLEVSQDYPLFFENSSGKYEIISDIDDTVLVSHAASILKRLYTLLFFRPKKRKAIVYTYDFLEEASQMGFRTIYLSKSESNLFGLISTFISQSELPNGALLLTPYMNFRQLIRTKKGKDYKERNLNDIFENSLDKEFILLGDDSQGDLKSYSNVARTHKDKIKAILIRKTGFGIDEEKMNFMDSIRNLGIETIYFSDDDEPDFSILSQ